MAAAPAELAQAMVTAPTAPADWLVVAPVIVPMAVGALLLTLRADTRVQPVLALTGLAVLVLLETALLARIAVHGPVAMTMGGWLPPFGISFVGDLTGALFVLAAGLVALVAAASAAGAIDAGGRRWGTFPFLLLMVAGVDGAFLTGDIFNLYVWFEVFLIASFGLLILDGTRAQIAAASKYAVLNLIATTLFLVATGLAYGAFGTLNMADIARKAPALAAAAPLKSLAALYLLAFAMKAAAFPLNFWLPASYHTPRIAIAALFGGLLTKVGIYALLRVLVMLLPAERAALSGLIGWIAAATMILGILGALAETDIRRLFGFVIISGVGVMLAGVALGTPHGLAGTIVYALHSMLSIAALYLLAGAMRDAGGSFSLAALGGLGSARPQLAAAALLLSLAAAGLPPGSGLWPKVMLVNAALQAGAGWLAAAILASGLLTTLAFGRVFLLAFWRDPPAPLPAGAADGRGSSEIALLVLMVPILAIGLYPEPLIRLAGTAAAGLVDPGGYIATVFPGEPR